MRIGWIGTGLMGMSMCMNVIRGGHKLYLYNRTMKSALGLLNNGAEWCESPKLVAQSSQVVFVMVATPEDVRQVFFNFKGLLDGAICGTTIIDMTSSSPKLAKDIYNKCLKKGVFSLDAPVSGGDIGAKNGTLAIMVGGDKRIYEKNLFLFNLIGNNIIYMGNAGSGQHTKMANQILIAGTMIGVVESLMYAQKAGMKLDDVVSIIGKGAASSWSINVLGKKIIDKDFRPGFFIKHFVKDMGIALREAKHMRLSLPGLSMVHQFYISAMAMGYENLGTQGLYKVLEKMNSVF